MGSEVNKGLYIGIMSGTSLDSVDVALCEIDGIACKLLSALEYPLPDELKSEILAMMESQTNLTKVGELDHRLGLLFAEAVNALLLREYLNPEDIKAIGSHGQTLWHEPGSSYPFSMQLGDPNIIAVRTGIPVVADFRRKDMALGGQGAPFAPAFHAFVFGAIEKKCAVVNIGGMANITILDDPLLGYDTGCGNVLINGWIARMKGKPYDKDGEWAASGSVDQSLLDRMLADPYFFLRAPKSTGREKFNMAWLETQLEGTMLPAEDIQATLSELTARSIAAEVNQYGRELLLLCGGGAKNSFLVKRIRTLLPETEVAMTDDYGVSSGFMEAMAFAWLAYKRIHREQVDLKDVTGARENSLLGGLYE
jgi:anhydro-N-acetylmuramic acid kinase